MGERVRIAVLGASGYTGADLVRLALTHPRIEIAALAANAKSGQTMAQIWPHFAPYPNLPRLVKADAIDFATIDAVFGCLPHAASVELLSTITGPRIIDLSADFRLKDAATYADWYGGAHPAPGLLPEAVYGLTEFARDALPAARIAACPGCYPTAVLLAFVTSHYIFRWRTAMNDYYVANWQRLRHVEGASQRIQEDTQRFATTLEQLGESLISALMTLIAFIPILWGLSVHVKELPLIGEIPQALVFVAVIWAALGTALLAIAGVRLPGLEFRNQRVEAAYRKELVYGEDDPTRARPPEAARLLPGVPQHLAMLALQIR